MTVNLRTNGHTTYPLPVVDWVRELSNAAWSNAINRRNNKPTMPNVYHPNKTQKMIQQAYEDALYMVALHLGNLSISRSQMADQGVTRARWEYARALLEMARLLDGWRIMVSDETTIRARLEGAFQRALAHPELFYARVPPSVRRKNQRRF